MGRTAGIDGGVNDCLGAGAGGAGGGSGLKTGKGIGGAVATSGSGSGSGIGSGSKSVSEKVVSSTAPNEAVVAEEVSSRRIAGPAAAACSCR